VHIWGIPDPVARVVAWHHQPNRAIERGGDIGKMVALLRVAETFEEHGGGDLSDEIAEAWAADPCFMHLGVDRGELKSLWDLGFAELMASSFFGLD
jgi:hypothetical protein